MEYKGKSVWYHFFSIAIGQFIRFGVQTLLRTFRLTKMMISDFCMPPAILEVLGYSFLNNRFIVY